VWHRACKALRRGRYAFDTKTRAKQNVVQAIERVAERLGNTKAVCRKCYVHPAVIEAYFDGLTIATLRARAEETLKGEIHELGPEEAAVMMLLRERLAESSRGSEGPARAA
jgi:DNA topoisomerase-1